MSVKNTHPQYDKYAPKWERCRDVMDGQDAMRARTMSAVVKGGVCVNMVGAYIPALKDQTPEDYAAYITRAPFYNATWRTVAGLSGMLFRKPMRVEVAEAVKKLLEDVTLQRCPFQTFAQEVSTEALGTGRVGVLADYPIVEKGATTQADAQRLNLRPTLALYKTEDIINWRTRVVNNAVLLSLVVLRESVEVAQDEFSHKEEYRFRVLDLDESNQYRVRLFRINDKGEDEQVGADMFPEMNGKRMAYIPFVVIAEDGVDYDAGEPPLIDLVDMNIAHWRSTADYEHGCHFAGLPTPVISGYVPLKEGDKLYIGSGAAWCFPDPAAKASFLEFTGQGLTALKDNIIDKEQRMAILGARMLEALKKGVEAAETAGIHRVGEQSALAAVAQSVSLGLTTALRWFAEWAGQSGTEGVEVEVNRDFFPVPMTPEMLTALTSSWIQGAISDQVLFENLQRGEVISHATTIEEESAARATSAPTLLASEDPESGPTKGQK